MPIKSLQEIAQELAAGYPSQNHETTQRDFTKVLEIVLPTLSKKATHAKQEGKDFTEEIWKAIRDGAESDFVEALAFVDRLKVLYITSKFMNNKAVGTALTEAALKFAELKED